MQIHHLKTTYTSSEQGGWADYARVARVEDPEEGLGGIFHVDFESCSLQAPLTNAYIRIYYM